jgi:hypothetical protein
VNQPLRFESSLLTFDQRTPFEFRKPILSHASTIGAGGRSFDNNSCCIITKSFSYRRDDKAASARPVFAMPMPTTISARFEHGKCKYRGKEGWIALKSVTHAGFFRIFAGHFRYI